MEGRYLCFAAVVASLFTCCLAYSNGTVPVILWHGMGLYFIRIAENLAFEDSCMYKKLSLRDE